MRHVDIMSDTPQKKGICEPAVSQQPELWSGIYQTPAMPDLPL